MMAKGVLTMFIADSIEARETGKVRTLCRPIMVQEERETATST